MEKSEQNQEFVGEKVSSLNEYLLQMLKPWDRTMLGSVVEIHAGAQKS